MTLPDILPTLIQGEASFSAQLAPAFLTVSDRKLDKGLGMTLH